MDTELWLDSFIAEIYMLSISLGDVYLCSHAAAEDDNVATETLSLFK